MTDQQQLLIRYLRILKRRFWIVVIVAAASVGVAYYYASTQHAEFRATAEVVLNTNSLPSQLVGGQTGQSGAQTQTRYAATQALLAHAPDVAARVVGNPALRGLPALSPRDLLGSSAVTSDPSSNILSFSVSYGSAYGAALIANTYASTFAAYRSAGNVAGVKLALTSLDGRIRSLARAYSTAETTGSPTAGALLRTLTKLQGQDQVLRNFLVASDTGAQVASTAAAVKIRPDIAKSSLIGLGVGVAVGLALILVVEALDTRIRTGHEAAGTLRLGQLGSVSTPSSRLRKQGRLAMQADDQGRAAEAFRKIRVNLDFANANVKAKTVLVTSAVEQEGKSTTVANLAIALADAGRRVILVDWDLRRPWQARFFNVSESPGLTGVLNGEAVVDAALVPVHLSTGRRRMPSGFTGGESGAVGALHLLPSGVLPPNPGEIAQSESAGPLLRDLESKADIVLVDTPPMLPVGDAAALSAVSGGMIVVARAGYVRRPMLVELRQTLDVCQCDILGFVLTGADHALGYSYGGYYSSRYSPRSAEAAPGSAVRADINSSRVAGGGERPAETR